MYGEEVGLGVGKICFTTVVPVLSARPTRPATPQEVRVGLGLKTGRENPVPTGTVYRLSRSDIVFTGKTGKNRKNPANPGAEAVEDFS